MNTYNFAEVTINGHSFVAHNGIYAPFDSSDWQTQGTFSNAPVEAFSVEKAIAELEVTIPISREDHAFLVDMCIPRFAVHPDTLVRMTESLGKSFVEFQERATIEANPYAPRNSLVALNELACEWIREMKLDAFRKQARTWFARKMSEGAAA